MPNTPRPDTQLNLIGIYSKTKDFEIKFHNYIIQKVIQQSSEETVPELKITRGKDDASTFFNDQKKKIDFVLVYEEDNKDIVIKLSQENS